MKNDEKFGPDWTDYRKKYHDLLQEKKWWKMSLNQLREKRETRHYTELKLKCLKSIAELNKKINQLMRLHNDSWLMENYDKYALFPEHGTIFVDDMLMRKMEKFVKEHKDFLLNSDDCVTFTF